MFHIRRHKSNLEIVTDAVVTVVSTPVIVFAWLTNRFIELLGG